MSRKGNCLDNAVMENWFGIMKTEFYYQEKFENIDLFKKVRATAEWKKFMEDGAFNTTFMTGKDYVAWVQKNEALHRDLMKEAGFLAKP